MNRGCRFGCLVLVALWAVIFVVVGWVARQAGIV